MLQMKKPFFLLLLMMGAMGLGSCNYLMGVLSAMTIDPMDTRSPVQKLDWRWSNEQTLNIVLFDDELLFYTGFEVKNAQPARLSGDPFIGDIVLEMKGRLGDNLQVQVKEFPSANPQMLDVLLKGMTSIGVLKYALVDPSELDEDIVAQYKKNKR